MPYLAAIVVIAAIAAALYFGSAGFRDTVKKVLGATAEATNAGANVVSGAAAGVDALGDLLKWLSPKTWADSGNQSNEARRDYLKKVVKYLDAIDPASIKVVGEGNIDGTNVSVNAFAVASASALTWLRVGPMASGYLRSHTPLVSVLIFGRTVLFPDGSTIRALLVPSDMAAAWGVLLSDESAEVDEDGAIVMTLGRRNPPRRLATLLAALARLAGVPAPGQPLWRVLNLTTTLNPVIVSPREFTVGFVCLPPGSERQYNENHNGLKNGRIDFNTTTASFRLENFHGASEYERGRWP